MEGSEDKVGTSTLKVFGTKATQSGLYKCIFYYKVGDTTYPVESNTAFVVVQGLSYNILIFRCCPRFEL